MVRRNRQFRRRTVLQTVGAGVLGGVALTGGASAEENHYGNGNGLGVFLNEDAMFKDDPLWDGEIANRMGQAVVDVAVGAMTPVNLPDFFPDLEALPVAYAPQVVKVSPGATVRWTWVSNPGGIPVPHDVVSLVDDDSEPVLEPDGHPRFHSPHYSYKESPDADEPDEEDLPTFEETFTDRGNHLYYCTPHGAPFVVREVEHPETGETVEVYNEFGMRGAVKVAGRPV